MKAKLLVYKGQPDPVWQLTPDDCKKLYDELRMLYGTMFPLDREGFLGYKGIEIKLDENEILTAFRGIVEIVKGNEIRRFTDFNRDLEIWLFSTSRDKVGDEVYNQLLVSEFK
jgi:hypothetical protein